MTTDLDRAFNTLKNKLPVIKTLWDYYNGEQPLKYSTDRLKEAFNKLNVRFIENWCALVVDTRIDRLNIKGIDLDDETGNNIIDEIWADNKINIDSIDIIRSVQVTSEGYLIIWKDADGNIETYVNDPELCHVFYKADKPKEKQFAAKWWFDESIDTWYMTLYYPDRLEKYLAKQKEMPTKASAFKPIGENFEKNPYGQIPVFYFKSESALKNIITLQDAVNKLFSDMMVTSEYHSFPQRWVISNSSTENLKNSPNELWELAAGDGAGQGTSVGQFNAADMKNYLETKDNVINSIAVITGTPKHYLTKTGANISGDALIAMEAPLTKKINRIKEMLTPTWQEACAFLLYLKDYQVKPTDIKVGWGPVESVQPYAEAQTMTLWKNIGVPIQTIMRWIGKTGSEIKQLFDDIAEERKNEQSLAQAVLTSIRNRTAQDNIE